MKVNFGLLLWPGLLLLAFLAGLLLTNSCNRSIAQKRNRQHMREMRKLSMELEHVKGRAAHAEALAAAIPDTVYQDSIVYIPVVAKEDAARPLLVQIQNTPDTATRQALEESTLVLGVEKKKTGLLVVQPIEPTGKVSQVSYPGEILNIPFRIDHTGKVYYDEHDLRKYRRRKFWHSFWQYTKGGIAGAGITAGFFLASGH